MSIKTRDELFGTLKGFLGEDLSEEQIAFVEDFTDTYNDLDTRARGDGVDWKQKYEENDKMWKQKYTDRFFSGTDPDPAPEPPKEIKSFDDLFKKEG